MKSELQRMRERTDRHLAELTGEVKAQGSKLNKALKELPICSEIRCDAPVVKGHRMIKK